MVFDVDRIIGLAEGRLTPTTGMEVHFIRVVKGEAIPASPEENDWIRLYKQSTRTGDAPPSNTPAVDLQQLRLPERERVELERERDDLETTTSHLRKELLALHERLLAQSLRENDREIEANQLRERCAELSESLENRIQSSIDARHRDIETEMRNVAKKNKRLAALIVELNAKIRKEHTKRIKCPVCEGHATYYDMSTYGTGADWEGRRPVDICGHCNGAGYIDNPEREIVERSEAEIAPLFGK